MPSERSENESNSAPASNETPGQLGHVSLGLFPWIRQSGNPPSLKTATKEALDSTTLHTMCTAYLRHRR